MILLNSDLPLARFLHQPLYDRLVKFTKEYAPENVAISVVEAWLKRLYDHDMTLQVIINMDEDRQIIDHSIVEIQEIPGGQNMIIVHQTCHDKPNLAELDEGVRYVKFLQNQVGAIGIMVHVSKNTRVYRERYGFKTVRAVMVQYATPEEEENSLDDL